MARVRNGELPWTNVDDLHAISLIELLAGLGITGFSDAHLGALNQPWRKLDPWPDTVDGLTRLKGGFVIATLPNGNVSQRVDLAKHGGLPWDVILSAELAHHYKPDAEVYLTAASLLGLALSQVVRVAAHPPDPAKAHAVSSRTAFVLRPLEHGPPRVADTERTQRHRASVVRTQTSSLQQSNLRRNVLASRSRYRPADLDSVLTPASL
jgi:2-haloacid dehalogenase